MTVKTEETIKMLEQQAKHATDPALKKSIQAKINALKGNKDILK